MSDNENDSDFNFTAEQYINGIISLHNYNDTYGLIVLENGIVLQVASLFEYFREQWNMYNTLLQRVEEEEDANEEKDEEEFSTEAIDELNEFLELTDNGILSNEEVEVRVQDISAMVAEYKQMEIIKAMKRKQDNVDENETFND